MPTAVDSRFEILRSTAEDYTDHSEDRMLKLTTLFAIVFVFAVVANAADQELRFDSVPDKSDVKVNGTSNLHDWTVNTPSITGDIKFKATAPQNATPEQLKEAIVNNPGA